MVQNITTGYRKLIEEAERQVEAVGVRQALDLFDEGRTRFVDLRDIRELDREGRIPGALHCPRGMLEFWIDPDSPYHKAFFADDRPFLFFCAAGWRSVLAAKTALDMGLKPVAHLEGGFAAWKEAGGPFNLPENGGSGREGNRIGKAAR